MFGKYQLKIFCSFRLKFEELACVCVSFEVSVRKLIRINERSKDSCIVIIIVVAVNVIDTREWLEFFWSEKEKFIESECISESQKKGCTMEGRI